MIFAWVKSASIALYPYDNVIMPSLNTLYLAKWSICELSDWLTFLILFRLWILLLGILPPLNCHNLYCNEVLNKLSDSSQVPKFKSNSCKKKNIPIIESSLFFTIVDNLRFRGENPPVNISLFVIKCTSFHTE